MKWYWAILTYLVGLALGITLIIFAYKAVIMDYKNCHWTLKRKEQPKNEKI